MKLNEGKISYDFLVSRPGILQLLTTMRKEKLMEMNDTLAVGRKIQNIER